MKLFNRNEYVIVSDFDGTITREDSNALLAEVCGNEENAQIEIDFIGGIIDNRSAFVRHFDAMQLTLRDYNDFIRSYIKIDPEFDSFLKLVREKNITLYIVSAGFRQAIEAVLGDERLNGVEVFANTLSGEPYITPKFATEMPDCDKPYGPCGNCKRNCITTIRQKCGRKILYIGDGITDRCVVGKADLLFAKDSLAKFCDENMPAYMPFNNFADIIVALDL